MPDRLPPLAFVDLETTGGLASTDRITEIAIVTLADGCSRRWSRLVNPQTRIPPFIERLTGITDAMVANEPGFAEIAEEVKARLDGFLFVAHNARFDYGFLKQEFRRVGIKFRAPVLCTVKLSRRLYPQYHRHGLDQLIERHGLSVAERHRALGDAQAICDFWQIACNEFGADRVQEVVRTLTARPALPLQLDPDLVDDLPEGHGVYLFYGVEDLPLYVGKSNRLRARVLSHFASDHRAAKDMSISRQVRRVEWVECAGEVEALLREAWLVKELQPALNRQLRRNRETCFWHLIDQGFGLLQPQLLAADALPDTGGSAPDGELVYGPFSSARAANERLQALARDHELCLVTLGLEKAAPGKPCFAWQVERCRGACVGEEPVIQNGIRLMEALGRYRMHGWPFAGPAVLHEGEAMHVVDRWSYLGIARDEAELAALLADRAREFDPDIYKILVKHQDRLRPLTFAGTDGHGASAR